MIFLFMGIMKRRLFEYIYTYKMLIHLKTSCAQKKFSPVQGIITHLVSGGRDTAEAIKF